MNNKAVTGFIAFGIALVLFASLFGLAAISTGTRKSPAPQEGSHHDPPAPARSKNASGKYPYPECEAIVRWLKENTGDPGAIEIISWEERRPYKYDDGTETVLIDVKFRGKNQFGAMTVANYRVEVAGPGQTVTVIHRD